MAKLSLTQIQRDINFSPRIERKTDVDVAEDYAACFEQLPPIVVYQVPDRKKYILVDGWHRYRAAEILGLKEVEVDAKAGSLDEAMEFALLANLKHGLPLTRKEKRHVIEEFLKLHPERSNSWIAGDLGAADKTVNTVREKLELDSEIPRVDKFITKDGKVYPRSPYIADDTKQKEATDEEAVGAEEEQFAEPEVSAVSMLGIYQLNKAHQVDCVEGLAGLPEESVDLVFADPPYNKGKNYGEGFKDRREEGEYFDWCMKWFLGVYRTLKSGGAFYAMHYPEIAAHWKQQLDNILTFRRWITWIYPSNIGHSDNNWRRSHRVILYYVKGKSIAFFDGEADPQPYKNPEDVRVAHLGKRGAIPYDWWEYDLVKNVSQEKEEWPNQLPLELMKRIVLSSCPEGGIVCDPFIGSGTTAEAAAKSNRIWLGFDIQAKACQMTNRRTKDLFSESDS